VAQIEELGFDNFYKRQAEVQAELAAYRATNGYFFSALLVTDVVQQSSLLLVAGPAKFVDSVPYLGIASGVFAMPGVVSRKKQLLPFLTGHLARVLPTLNGAV